MGHSVYGAGPPVWPQTPDLDVWRISKRSLLSVFITLDSRPNCIMQTGALLEDELQEKQ
jgi:hypothetical protein